MTARDSPIEPPSSPGGNDGSRRRHRLPRALPTAREVSAGGLLVDGVMDASGEACAVLIGRPDARGMTQWSFPKGHIEVGERPEDAAVREVFEETGFHGRLLAALGNFDYWFVAQNRRVHKLVHHYLLQHTGGELSLADHEVTDVSWFPLTDLSKILAYPQERQLATVAIGLMALRREEGAAALPALPSTRPRRRRQTHLRSRRHDGD